MSDPEGTEPAIPEKPEKSAYEKLSSRYRLFVDHLIEGKTGADAARLIGFGGKQPKLYACRLRKRLDIQAALVEREAEAMQEAGISLVRSWIEVRRIAYFDPARLVNENGEHLPLHKLDEDTRAAIAGVEVEELYEGEGRAKIRIGDLKKYRISNKLEANKLILQKKGELVDKSEDLTPRATPVIQIVRYSDSKPEGDAQPDPPRAD